MQTGENVSVVSVGQGSSEGPMQKPEIKSGSQLVSGAKRGSLLRLSG